MNQRILNNGIVILLLLILGLSLLPYKVNSTNLNVSNLPIETKQEFEISIETNKTEIIKIENYYLLNIVGFAVEFFENSTMLQNSWIDREFEETLDVRPLNIDYVLGNSRSIISYRSWSNFKFFIQDLKGISDLELEIDPKQSEPVNLFVKVISIRTVHSHLTSDTQGTQVIIGYVSGKLISCCSDTPSDIYLGSEANVDIYLRKYVEQAISVSFFHKIKKPDQETITVDSLLNVTLDDDQFHTFNIILPEPSEYNQDSKYNWYSEIYLTVETPNTNVTNLGFYGVINDSGNKNPVWTDQGSLNWIWIIFPLMLIPILRNRRR